MIPQTQTPHPVVPPSWLHVCNSFRWLHRTIYKRTPFLMKSNSANRPKPTAEGSVDFRDGPFQIGRPPPKYLNTDTRTRTARVGSCNNRWLWGTLWPPRIRRYHHPWEREREMPGDDLQHSTRTARVRKDYGSVLSHLGLQPMKVYLPPAGCRKTDSILRIANQTLPTSAVDWETDSPRPTNLSRGAAEGSTWENDDKGRYVWVENAIQYILHRYRWFGSMGARRDAMAFRLNQVVIPGRPVLLEDTWLYGAINCCAKHLSGGGQTRCALLQKKCRKP